MSDSFTVGRRMAVKFYKVKRPFKLRAFNHAFRLPDYFATMIGEKTSVRIADLGAGAISTTGSQWPNVEVEVVASDLLAEDYGRYYKKLLIPVETQDMEALTYPDKSFDIVHCVNALDHCTNPRKALQEMIRISKEWVYLRHASNEGETEKYAGFHQWNIEKKGDDCRIWSRNDEFLLSEIHPNFKTVMRDEFLSPYPLGVQVVSTLKL